MGLFGRERCHCLSEAQQIPMTLGRWLYYKAYDFEGWCYRWYEFQPFKWLSRPLQPILRFLYRYAPPPSVTKSDLAGLIYEVYAPVLAARFDVYSPLESPLKDKS